MELNKQHVEVRLGIRNKKEIEINDTGLRGTFDGILTCATQETLIVTCSCNIVRFPNMHFSYIIVPISFPVLVLVPV